MDQFDRWLQMATYHRNEYERSWREARPHTIHTWTPRKPWIVRIIEAIKGSSEKESDVAHIFNDDTSHLMDWHKLKAELYEWHIMEYLTVSSDVARFRRANYE